MYAPATEAYWIISHRFPTCTRARGVVAKFYAFVLGQMMFRELQVERRSNENQVQKSFLQRSDVCLATSSGGALGIALARAIYKQMGARESVAEERY